MSDQASWLVANDRHLAASVTWLRLRLERLAAQLDRAAPATVERVEALPPEEHRRRSWRRSEEPARVPLLEAPAAHGAGRNLDRCLADAEAAVREAEHGMSPPPALVQIADLFELGRFARNLLLLAAAPELDPSLSSLLTTLHGQPWPTYALGALVLDDPDWESRSPGGPLRRWRLVEADQSGGPGLSSCPLRVDERVLNALKGLNHLDARLAGVLVAEPPPTSPLPASQQASVAQAMETARTGSADSPLIVVQLMGASAPSRRAVARQVAAELGGPLFRLQTRLLVGGAEHLEQLALVWHREVLLSGAVLLLDEEDGDIGSPEVGAFLARTGGLVLVGVPEVARDLPGSPGVVEVIQPTVQEQLELWREALALASAGDTVSADVAAASEGGLAQGGKPDGLDEVVEQFDLDADTIRAVVARAGSTGRVGPRDLWDAARRQRRPRLESAAQRIRPVATWDDLVLPEPQRTQLARIASQVRHRHRVHRDWGFAARMNRGLGVSALFAGESGTGKSMTAEVLANDLDLDLFRIDLSAVVSKYIGETEKNLRRLFDAAEGGGVILFFDEADALFGKRSEVKDAHDRYANIETNYLLQRMEGYGGLAILATNMRSALDKAFARRIRFIVEFPFPSSEDRLTMWAQAFPPEADVEDLDLARLARIDLTGAGIAGAALGAAFTAAAEGRAVSTTDVLSAARDELRKLQRPVIESQFRLPATEGRAS